jgi:hypothetical protein
MATENTTQKLIDVRIPIPNDTEKTFHIELSAKTMNRAKKIIDELILARHIPYDPDAISIGDPLALIISQMKGKRDRAGDNAVLEASETYKRWMRDAQSDGFTVAMTASNELTNEPTAYVKDAVEDDEPAWLVEAAKTNIPEPTKNLSNPYERRLKQVEDYVNSFDATFQMSVASAINNAFAAAVQLVEADESDEDNFSVKPSSPSVRKGAKSNR